MLFTASLDLCPLRAFIGGVLGRLWGAADGGIGALRGAGPLAGLVGALLLEGLGIAVLTGFL